MERVELDGWTLAGAGIEVPATVPGCVHTDLLAAGLIPDPYVDDNELRVAWVGHTEWAFTTTFDRPPAGRVDLVADGLDTVATIAVNGTEIGRTANMHRGYRFDLRDVLRDGDNELTVTFTPAYDYAEQQRDRLGDRPGAYDQPYPFVRKMACNFGWDWGPTLVTAGIYRPIALETWSVARLATVRPLVTVDGGTGRVRAEVEVERDTDEPLVLTATLAGTTVQGPPGEPLDLEIDDPARWWPRGYGDQPRYDLAVTLATEAGRVLDRWQRRIGFRDVRLDTTPDAHGTPYTLVVNDVPIFVRGFNWIPDDAFVTRVTRDRYARRLGQAVDANANYLRVWGGGLYESDDFYDLADEYGLMVGQDFLFACAAYPEEEPFASEVAAEAHEQVVRLASHPSLVLWTGNNENLWGWYDWGWQEPLAGRTWGAGFYFDLLPRIVAELDPTRPYWPGSPWSGGQWSGGQWSGSQWSGSHDRHPNDPAHGTTHEWRVWNQVDYCHYRDYVPRFMSEFGYQAPPAYATLRRYLADDPLAPDSPGMAHHQKAIGGDEKLRRGLDAHLPVPEDFDDWHYLTQVNQARAVALGVAHYRSHRPVCMGTIVWQLNDTWPATSWAAVDVDGRCKPLWHALRRLYADRIITIEPRGDGLALVAVNESATPWSGAASVSLYTVDGARLGTETVEVAVPVRSAATVPLTVTGSPDLIVAELGGQRAWWFFTEDKDLRYPRPRYTADVTQVPGGLAVTITAGTILRDLTLYPDRLDPAATVDDALVTLLPGESATFTVRTSQPLDPAALTSRPVLRCVNDVGR